MSLTSKCKFSDYIVLLLTYCTTDLVNEVSFMKVFIRKTEWIMTVSNSLFTTLNCTQMRLVDFRRLATVREGNRSSGYFQ